MPVARNTVTLIQTITTDDLVIQVADRRLSSAVSGEPIEDELTKLVCWNMTFSIGFTGLARIDRAQKKSTSEWIAETVCDYPTFETGVQALGYHARERISKLPSTWPDRRLAIVLAGFGADGEQLAAEISNFRVGGPMHTDPTDFKAWKLFRAQGQKSSFHVAGAGLTDKWQRQVLRSLVPRVLRQPDGLSRAVKLMVALQRSVAKTNQGVGTNAMAVTIPRATTGDMIMSHVEGNLLDTGTGQFSYFDTDGFAYRQLGPHIARGGMAMANCLAEADPNKPDNMAVSCRTLKWPMPPPAPASA